MEEKEQGNDCAIWRAIKLEAGKINTIVYIEVFSKISPHNLLYRMLLYNVRYADYNPVSAAGQSNIGFILRTRIKGR